MSGNFLCVFQCEFMFHVFQRRKQNRVGVCLKLRLQEIVFAKNGWFR